jgi:6-phosphofructokinase 1
MSFVNKILVLTSGGDAPGMNAVIRAVVRTANNQPKFKVEIYGCHDGYQGLVNQDIFQMSNLDVAGVIQSGGTILRSSRCKAFFDKEVRAKAIEFLKAKGINGLIVIGGDGSYRAASLLEEEGGPKCIGIPGTIDNDIVGTDYTIGFDTACNTALHAIDNIRDTAHSSNRYFLIEVMGQRSGFIAANVGLACGAEFIITPEFPLTAEELAEKINKPKRKKRSLIVVVAEAGSPGCSLKMADRLRELTPFEYRVCILGHIQRGGSPTLIDREMGSIMGNLAVESLIAGKSNLMTVWIKGILTLAPFPGSEAPCRKLENDKRLKLGEFLAL